MKVTGNKARLINWLLE